MISAINFKRFKLKNKRKISRNNERINDDVIINVYFIYLSVRFTTEPTKSDCIFVAPLHVNLQ